MATGITAVIAGAVNATGVIGKGAVSIAQKFGLKTEGHVFNPKIAALLQPPSGAGAFSVALTEKGISLLPDFSVDAGKNLFGEALEGLTKSSTSGKQNLTTLNPAPSPKKH